MRYCGYQPTAQIGDIYPPPPIGAKSNVIQYGLKGANRMPMDYCTECNECYFTNAIHYIDSKTLCNDCLKLYLKEKQLDIVNFIKGMNFFRDGYSYHFAVILEKMYSGKLYYNPIKNDFIVKTYGKFYDINGEVSTFEEYFEWKQFQQENQDKTSQIYKECIYKEDWSKV